MDTLLRFTENLSEIGLRLFPAPPITTVWLFGRIIYRFPLENYRDRGHRHQR